MKKRIVIISVLLIITASLVFIYLRSRPSVNAGDILIRSQKGDLTVALKDLDLVDVHGSIKNKKGETKEIDSKGIALSQIPSLAGISDYSELSVFADDEYKAVMSGEELKQPDNAWLIMTDDGGIRLVVFNDTDSKRDVKNVVRVEVE